LVQVRHLEEKRAPRARDGSGLLGVPVWERDQRLVFLVIEGPTGPGTERFSV